MPSKKTRKQLESGHFSGDLAWRDAVEHAIRSAVGDRAVNGAALPVVSVISTSKRGNVIEMELRFQKGNSYCCGEPICFIHAYDKSWWVRFRDALSESTDRSPASFRLHVACAVEPGTKLRVNSLVGSSIVSKGYAGTARFDEKDAK